MDENNNIPQNQPSTQQPQGERPANPRPPRERRTKQEIFKETRLPLIIMAAAAVLIVIFIAGSITRGIQKRHTERDASIAMSESIAAEESRLNAEMADILTRADQMAENYDYDGAIALVDSFSGNIGGYPQLQDAKARYEYSKQALVPWEDPSTILSLIVNPLIADTDRAYYHPEYASSFKNNFLTTDEFRNLLQRLYESDYILVNMSDFVEVTVSDSGVSTYKYKELYLPEGKKPVVLTEANACYSLYLVDSDDDMIADKGGVGMANKMLFDDAGNIVTELVNADGSVSTGAYDVVPILDAFVEEHPDFSYRGAKAVLALTGYNGVFGYRTHPDGRVTLGEEEYEKNVETIKTLAAALTDSGYELACYTYANSSYGAFSVSQIQSDIAKWTDEVVPIIGKTEILVFAQNSDIGSGMLYSGEKYDYLKAAGFNYFISPLTDGNPFTFISDDYVRQGRLFVSRATIKAQENWFSSIMDTEGIINDEIRNTSAE